VGGAAGAPPGQRLDSGPTRRGQVGQPAARNVAEVGLDVRGRADPHENGSVLRCGRRDADVAENRAKVGAIGALLQDHRVEHQGVAGCRAM
jgi:hypothetical protein